MMKTFNIKKCTAVVLVICYVFFFSLFSVSAIVEVINVRENNGVYFELVPDNEAGSVESFIMTDKNGNSVEAEKNGSILKTNAAVPTSYNLVDYNKVTSVKNQGNLSTCWAFAAISAVESNAIVNGLASSSNADFSEDHLVWFSNTINSKTGDGRSFTASSTGSAANPYNVGGGIYLSSATLASWSGTELESNAPYNTSAAANGQMPESERSSSYAHLENFYIIANRNSQLRANLNYVKATIMEYGAADASYYDCANGLGSTGTSKYSYYQNSYDDSSTNHEVAIIGWDDNYSKNNFKVGQRPSANGAWLVKNSWGSSYGSNGYMWISYYEPSLCKVCVFEMSSTDNYDNIYQNNSIYPSSIVSFKSFGTMASAFKANKSETLKAISLYTYQNSVTAEIKIYTDLPSGYTAPTDGVLREECTTTSSLDFEGYHTIKLKNPVTLDAGENYAVVVTLKTFDSENIYLLFEGESKSVRYSDGSKTNYTYSSEKGQSYLLAGDKWYDGNTSRYGGIRLNNCTIKAFTDTQAPGKSYTVAFNANGGSVSKSSANVNAGASVVLPTPSKSFTITYNANGGSGAPSAQSQSLSCAGWSASRTADKASFSCGAAYKPSSSITLYAVWEAGANIKLSTVNPTRSGYEFLGWSTSPTASSANYYSGGNVSLKGNVTLYAVWQAKTSGSDVKATLYLSESNLAVNKGSEFTLNCTYYANYECDVYLGCSISDNSAISCSWGEWSDTTIPMTVTAKNYGVYTIEVLILDSKTDVIYDTETVTVTIAQEKQNAAPEVEPLVLGTQDFSLYAGAKRTIEAQSEYKISWSSSNNDIATVNANGEVTANSAGTAVITASVKDSEGNVCSRTCTVTVNSSWWQQLIYKILALFGMLG